ncbi:sensor histidine kinase [Microbacterium sp. 3H14]|nr:sensor histidine kinase [Microbacterium sp. 3H14]
MGWSFRWMWSSILRGRDCRHIDRSASAGSIERMMHSAGARIIVGDMTPAPSSDSTTRPVEMSTIDIAVDVAFAVLLVVCGSRYVVNHGLDEVGVFVLIGASISWLAYLAGRVREPSVVRRRVGVAVAITAWIVLVVAAPSFAWCALPLFFAAHRAFSGAWALALTVMIVVAVGVSLYRWSGWLDIGMLFGPLCAGGILTLAYAALERLHAARGALITELETTQARLASTEREAGREAERRRLAAELHDTVVQGTASALLLLEAEEQRNGGASPESIRAQDVLRANLVETRRVVHGLSSTRLAEHSLASALAESAAELGAELHMIGTDHAISEPQAHALLRIAQEAMVNAVRHAHADRVIVTLTFDQARIGIDVGDDGIGFDPEAAGRADRGYGLRAMRWRATTAGGTFDVESSPGNGTIISATVPSSPLPPRTAEHGG